MGAPESDRPDPCVVDTAPLAGLIVEFVTDWKRTRPPTKGQKGREPDAIDPVSAYEWLAAETGVPETTLRAMRYPDRAPITELRYADRIAFALGRPELLYDGTLNVRVNPRCPQELRASAANEAAAWNSPIVGEVA